MQCPSCQKQVDVKDKDVGALFTCPQCRSVYFINFDGTPDFGEVQQPSAEELQRLQNLAIPEKKKKKKSKKDEDESEQQNVAADPQPEVPAFDAAPVMPFEQEVPAMDLSQNETPAFELQPAESFSLSEPQTPFENLPQEPMSIEPMAAEPLPIEALPTETPSIENFSYEAPVENVAPPQAAPTDFNSIASEIENFGNQQTVVAGISYDLEVTGLDTKEAQELLREAIDDSRFAWHPDDVVREIRTGTCHFKNLTPVQAFVLAKRIQFIDLEMKWKQNVLA